MEHLKVRMDEWFLTQGMVGYKKILEQYGETVKTTYDGIIVEKHHLEILPDAFFSHYLKTYSVAKREERIIRGLHKRFKSGETQAKRLLNARLNDLKKSSHRYFQETNEGINLGLAADAYRAEKNYNTELDNQINIFIENLSFPEIDEKLTANFFKAVHLSPHYGQVSVLNVTHNKRTLEEQKGIFFKDFINPVLEEWKLVSALDAGDESEINAVLEGTTHGSFNQIKRGFRKKTLDEKREFIEQEIHRCSLTDFPLAFENFEEGIFSPLALSIGNARNMSWDANGKSFLPISSLARLLIFCAQAGATDTQNKSAFIYYGGSFDEIYQSNQTYDNLKGDSKTFDQIVFDLVREQKLKADFTKKRYMIYEYESDYQSKRTLLDYMIMTPNLMKLFSEDSKLFDHIHFTLKSKMIRFLLRDIDTRHLISSVLRDKIKESYPVLDVIRLIQIRHLNQLYKEEVKDVDSTIEKRRVWVLVKSAEEVKHRIGTKKAQGIAYRLLNSIRSNDKNTFMDTVMRVYISSELEMPGLLLEALHEENMDFATVGNAWVAGLVSKSEKEKGENENE